MKYKIGLILPDSNYFPRLGKDYRQTVEAGLKKSGFTDYEIAVEPGGYNNQMKIMAEKVHSLIIKDQVDLIIAPFNPAFLVDIAPLLLSNEVLLLLTFMGEDTIHEDCNLDFTFVNTCDLTKSTWIQGYEAGKKFGTNGTYMASFHDGGYGMSRAFTFGFESTGGKLGFSTVTHKEKRMESSVEIVNQVLEEKADFVFGFYSSKEAISLTEDWDNAEGEKTPFLPSYMMHGDDVLEACGKKLVGQKTVGSWDRDSNNESNVELKTFFETNLGKKPHPYGLLAYETGMLLGKALRSTSSDNSPKVVKEALTSVSITGPRGDVHFDTQTHLTPTTDYEFEVVEEEGKIIRKKIREIPVPDEYHEFLDDSIKNIIKSGWTNPYLIG